MSKTTKRTNANGLAIEGGRPVRSRPMPPRKLFGEAEKQAVVDLFDKAMAEGSDALAYHGPDEEAYCRAFARTLGGGYADGVNSGTNAVYVALRALELPPFSEVIVPAISDPGGIMPVALCNLLPIPADTAPMSYNIGAEQIAARITRRTSAIVVAHIGGLPCDMHPIIRLARKHALAVVEDAAQAHGAVYKGRPVGTLGDVAAFSTMWGKHYASAGQGGMVFTRDEDMYWKVRSCADRGKPFNLAGANGNVVAGLNCNMDSVQAAVGRVQLRRLGGMVRKRQRLAAALAKGCRERLKAFRLLEAQSGCEGSYWCIFLRYRPELFRVDKAYLTRAICAEGIPISPTYAVVPMWMDWALHRNAFGRPGPPWTLPGCKPAGPRRYDLPNMRATDAVHFRLPFHEGWTLREINDVVRALEKIEGHCLA